MVQVPADCQLDECSVLENSLRTVRVLPGSDLSIVCRVTLLSPVQDELIDSIPLWCNFNVVELLDCSSAVEWLEGSQGHPCSWMCADILIVGPLNDQWVR